MYVQGTRSELNRNYPPDFFIRLLWCIIKSFPTHAVLLVGNIRCLPVLPIFLTVEVKSELSYANSITFSVNHHILLPPSLIKITLIWPSWTLNLCSHLLSLFCDWPQPSAYITSQTPVLASVDQGDLSKEESRKERWPSASRQANVGRLRTLTCSCWWAARWRPGWRRCLTRSSAPWWRATIGCRGPTSGKLDRERLLATESAQSAQSGTLGWHKTNLRCGLLISFASVGGTQWMRVTSGGGRWRLVRTRATQTSLVPALPTLPATTRTPSPPVAFATRLTGIAVSSALSYLITSRNILQVEMLVQERIYIEHIYTWIISFNEDLCVSKDLCALMLGLVPLAT